MGIQLTNIRVKSFRSIEYMDTSLNDINILIGQNNCGKSNFLRAIYIALNAKCSVSSKDIFVADGEAIAKDKNCIIDILLRPTNDQSEVCTTFSDFWTGVFTTSWITTDETYGDFVGIRTIIEYDSKFDQYVLSRKVINQWNDSIDDAICGKKQSFTSDMQAYISCFYMDAHRDILEDLKSKTSFLGKSTSSKDISPELVHEIEESLNSINTKLIENTPALKDTQSAISEISHIIGTHGSQLSIEPINRTIADIHRGMDIKFKDGGGPNLSVSEHGMGIRSWISFLTLGAYISYLTKSITKEDEDDELFVVLALEEPEAHLHSFAQKKLFSQIKSFCGQKIISTHSANIVAQGAVNDFIHLYKDKGKTYVSRIKPTEYGLEEIAKIHREFINTKGDLLFSTAIVLAEGITEGTALPIYFEQYFKADANSMGVSILGIGGQNYKTFLRLVRDFRIPWYIFSDGEPTAIKSVSNAVKEIFNKELKDCPNVIILDDGDDYEDHLIRSGYASYMINAINKYEKELREEVNPAGAAADPRDYFDRYIEKNNHSSAGQKKTGEKCTECGQYLMEPIVKIYDGEEGKKRALLDCCQKGNGKAKYAYIIASEIVQNAPDGQKIPPKAMELFEQMKKELIGGE